MICQNLEKEFWDPAFLFICTIGRSHCLLWAHYNLKHTWRMWTNKIRYNHYSVWLTVIPLASPLQQREFYVISSLISVQSCSCHICSDSHYGNRCSVLWPRCLLLPHRPSNPCQMWTWGCQSFQLRYKNEITTGRQKKYLWKNNGKETCVH